MAFRGFPLEALDFYAGLEADNSKTYWSAHKDVYESAVRGPMEQLLAALPEAYQPFYVFRPYRDVRFSNDKSPYKTQLGAGSETERGSVHYVQISRTGVLVGAGMYRLARDQLERFRAAVAADRSGPGLEQLVDGLRRAGHRVEPGHDAPLTRAPRGISPDHPRIELLRWKGCIAFGEVTEPSMLQSAALRAEIVRFWERCAPLLAWLDEHVGPSTEPERDRR